SERRPQDGFIKRETSLHKGLVRQGLNQPYLDASFFATLRGAAMPSTLCAKDTQAGWSTPPRSSVQISTPRVLAVSGSS
ncbi:hypothetical protein, partial [Burkholderia sp. BCCCDS15]|uniref:hypothetical protein n=1 Tax=unclassified Burkholderia TaxID=2613784 RepID=UPI003D2EFE50